MIWTRINPRESINMGHGATRSLGAQCDLGHDHRDRAAAVACFLDRNDPDGTRRLNDWVPLWVDDEA